MELENISAAELVVKPIKDRLLKHNKNFMCVICGETGSGKSYSALKLAEMIDPNFNINHVVFSGQEFMELLNKPDELPAGSVLIWDEAGVNMASRDFASLFNKLLMKVLQTFRHRNICCIFTVPSFSFIDIQARKLLHAYIETCGINRKEKKVVTKFLFLQSSARYGDKIYYHYPLIKDENTKYAKVTRVNFYKASKPLLKAYEERREVFTAKLNKAIAQQLNRTEVKSNKETFDPKEVADKLMPTIDKIKTPSGRITAAGVMNATGLSLPRAQQVRHLLITTVINKNIH